MLPILIGAAALAGSPSPVAVVSSGGVSLGSYQAGFLYLLVESSKLEARPAPLWVGASAGAANSLLAGMMRCEDRQPDPRASLGWKVWLPVGFGALVDPDGVRSDGLLSRRVLVRATDRIWRRLEEGLPADCDFVVGVSTTRLRVYRTEFASGLRIPRQEEKFGFRVRGQGPGRPVRFESYVDPYSDVPKPILPLERGEGPDVAQRNFERVRGLLFASMAFPVAFAPQWLGLCLTQPPPPDRYEPTWGRDCLEPEQVAQFVDGGVLDNSPIRHAFELADMGLRRDSEGALTWRDPATSAWTDPRPRPQDLAYVLLDPSLTVYPVATPQRGDLQRSDVLTLVGTLFDSFVTAARSKELYTLVEEQNVAPAAVRPGYRFEPAAGDPLFWFMGFFESSFRRFDHALGMLDGLRFLRRNGMAVPAGADGAPPPGLEGAWAGVLCLQSWLEPGYAADRRWCERVDRNFRVLLQTSIDRLWNRCRSEPDPSEELLVAHPMCRLAAEDGLRPWTLDAPFEALAPAPDGASDFDQAIERLAAYRFAFRDLGLSADQADQVAQVLREELNAAFRRFARAQPDALSQRVVDSAGRVLANQLAYQSPPWAVQLLVGGSLEAGVLAAAIPRWRSWLRLTAALQTDGWLSWLTPAEDGLALGVVAGPEVLIPGLTGPLVQLAAGVRGGYRFSSRDAFGTDPCPEAEQGRGLRCSQGIVQPYAAVSLLDRFRLLAGLDLFPALVGRPGAGSDAYGARLGLGILLY
jgi:hypothetical protein